MTRRPRRHPRRLPGRLPRPQLLESPRQRYADGQRLRQRLPRKEHGTWDLLHPTPERLRPIEEVNKGRLPQLVPEKWKRMRASPFAFFRGAAALMAADLARTPISGIGVQLCGDAHVRNLGAYEALDGSLVFDINDFDETTPGPWEWDVKRLSTSLILAGEESGVSASRCEESVLLFVGSYRAFLRRFAAMRFAALSRYRITRRRRTPLLEEIFREAERVTPMRNLQKLAIKRDGRFRFHDRPPLLEHVPAGIASGVLKALAPYSRTLIPSRRRTFERYRPVDVAFKLVGTGSVGTRDYVVLMFGNGPRDPLFIQVKQELPSCYTPYLQRALPMKHDGRRVSEGQQMMQTLSDPLLGYTQVDGRDYLVRQLADHKAALDPAELTGATLDEFAMLCGEVLAKGHARTGDAALLAGYTGKGPKLDRAMAAFAMAYAEQVRSDFKLFCRLKRARAWRSRPAYPRPR